VDFSLKPDLNRGISREKKVSILVLVDFSLKHYFFNFCVEKGWSFNPCFGGFFSKTFLFQSNPDILG